MENNGMLAVRRDGVDMEVAVFFHLHRPDAESV
jgi:hypothetical protein